MLFPEFSARLKDLFEIPYYPVTGDFYLLRTKPFSIQF